MEIRKAKMVNMSQIGTFDFNYSHKDTPHGCLPIHI